MFVRSSIVLLLPPPVMPARSGTGMIGVRAASLDTHAILDAMEAGEYYSTRSAGR